MRAGGVRITRLTWPMDLAVRDRPTPPSCRQFPSEEPQGPPSVLCSQPGLLAPFPDCSSHPFHGLGVAHHTWVMEGTPRVAG